MVGQRQQAFEYGGLGDITIKNGRNHLRAGFGEQRHRPLGPAWISEYRRRARDLAQRQPIGLRRKTSAEVHNLPLAGLINDHAGDR